MHAAQNKQLPVQAAIQVLFSEQSKLSRSVVDQVVERRCFEALKLVQLVAGADGKTLLEKKKGFFKWRKKERTMLVTDLP